MANPQTNVKNNLSPEGYKKSDLCPHSELCGKYTCQKYHPLWALGLCIQYLQ